MSQPHGTPESHTEQDHAPDSHAGGGDHEAGHGDGHADGHGHDAVVLGPVDWPMWGVGVVGLLAAAVLTVALVVATGFSFTA